ncbi:hypothetical protein JGS22_005160 [Streptomyces sp. P38-E01]|uniref:CBM6 domain-containing protein n=1 Tax=Streptomyces tardus TaxID=2780544 RepID=A0A949JMW0_9ACTN|nr:hypothetical protein [Streptomyces tardus]MBU7597040.1 hypothetical protein [Streptomyces tardus]
MTAGNNGTNPPEGDDPFGYLYRSENGAPSAQGQQANSPRRSYNEVRAVGDRRYGQQQRPQPDQSPSPYYAAPETQPGGGQGGSGGPGRRAAGRANQEPARRNGLLIGALAVVGAVILGVGAAFAFSDSDDDKAGADPGASESADAGQDDAPDPDDGPPEEDEERPLPQENGSSLRLENGPVVAGDVEGSRAKDGSYIHGFKEGSAALWQPEIEEDGEYTVFVGYTVPGKDMSLQVSANDASPYSARFSNYAGAEEGDWAKGWTQTFAWVELKKGTNDIRIACGDKAEQCSVAMDRIWLEKGHVKK